MAQWKRSCTIIKYIEVRYPDSWIRAYNPENQWMFLICQSFKIPQWLVNVMFSHVVQTDTLLHFEATSCFLRIPSALSSGRCCPETGSRAAGRQLVGCRTGPDIHPTRLARLGQTNRSDYEFCKPFSSHQSFKVTTSLHLEICDIFRIILSSCLIKGDKFSHC